MTDRELLILAAKGAGHLTPSWYDSDAYISGFLSNWNPLTDDGDALRLAVKLGMDIHQVTYCKEPYAFVVSDAAVEPLEPYESDPYAATRRAITRAAAEIGRQMK